jgi:RNA polymerase sigma-70 factor (ECF subfamily)
MRLHSVLLCGRISFALLRANLARSPAPVPFSSGLRFDHLSTPNTETEVNMAIINLRDYYPFYTSDCFMEVSEEVAEMFKEFDRKEAAYRLRTYRHKAYYSLDRDDGLEHEAVFVALSPHELYERKVTMQELHAAIASLPNKQAKRIYAHFILGMTKQDIARAEGVHEKVVRVAIERGLRRLEKILKNSL